MRRSQYPSFCWGIKAVSLGYRITDRQRVTLLPERAEEQVTASQCACPAFLPPESEGKWGETGESPSVPSCRHRVRGQGERQRGEPQCAFLPPESGADRGESPSVPALPSCRHRVRREGGRQRGEPQCACPAFLPPQSEGRGGETEGRAPVCLPCLPAATEWGERGTDRESSKDKTL